jgi:hypothetical protein
MEKPKPYIKEYLKWDEVCDYLEELTGRDLDDWNGKYTNGHNKDAEFEAFSIWLTDKYGDYGSSFVLHEDVLDGASYEELENEPQFVKDIHELIFKEFGEYADNGYLEFVIE